MFNKIFGNIIPPGLNLNQKDVMVNCPFHKDTNASFSISTDPNKPVYRCFGCPEKGSWIGYYMKTKGLTYPQAMGELGMDNTPSAPYVAPPPPPPKLVIDYYNEWVAASNNVHNNYEVHCRKLWELTGLTLPTAIACGIGFNNEGWIFPVFRYSDAMCVGYEIRKSDFGKFINPYSQKETKCYKAKDTPSCLCYIYQSEKRKCYITEGFKDGYFLYQFLSEKNPSEQVKETIISPSCGVGHLPELLRENPLDEYEEVILILDNDKAGNEARALIENLSPKYKFFSGLAENEDFEEYYKRIKK